VTAGSQDLKSQAWAGIGRGFDSGRRRGEDRGRKRHRRMRTSGGLRSDGMGSLGWVVDKGGGGGGGKGVVKTRCDPQLKVICCCCLTPSCV